MKAIRAGVATAIIAAALVVGSAVSAQAAYQYPYYYGYANCSPKHATATTSSSGSVVHQFGTGVAESYQSWSYANGSTITTRYTNSQMLNTAWMTIGSTTSIGPSSRHYECK